MMESPSPQAVPPPVLPAKTASIARAAALIREGRLVAFPTETVYGLGADATNDHAVASIFAAKGRPRFNPLIVHFADPDDAFREVMADPRAATLASMFWPGPLSLVLKRRPGCRLSRLVSAGLDSVALRVPASTTARRLIAACERPLAAPSANRSGDISPTTAAHVVASLNGAPALVLDDGPCAVGLESTVIDLSGDNALLLRPGAITAEAIALRIGPLATLADEAEGVPRTAPGRMARHYAPGHPLRLEARTVAPDEGLLAFGPRPLSGARITRNLSPGGDLVEAAANLFAMLHELDNAPVRAIAAMPVPDTGIGIAINDRLRRAAVPLSDPEACA